MLLLVLSLASLPGAQQAAGQPPAATLTGKVVDRRGDAIPGVTVSLQAPPPVVNQTVVTDREGAYRFSGIPSGTYTLRFEIAGFETYTRTRLDFAAGQTYSRTVALEVAPLAIADAVDSSPPPPDPSFDLARGEVAVGITTSKGTFYIAVDTDHAPITAANFLKYVDAGLYARGRFHRATRLDNYTPAPPNRPMMNIIQGGIDPTRRAEGFPAIPLERTSVTGLKHVTGVVSMARGGPDSATSDFFVLLDDQPSLDFGGLRFDDAQGAAAFGRVLSGLDVVRRIQQEPVDGQNLTAPVTILRAWRLQSK